MTAIIENEMAGDFIAPAGAQSGFEPQRVNNFMLDIAVPNGVPNAAGVAKAIRMSLQSFPFPKRETEATAINYINIQRKVPGKTTYADVDLVVKDYIDAATAKHLNDWLQLVHSSETGNTGLAREIKATATLTLFAPNNQSPRKWQIFGLWPRSINHGDGNMDSADVNMLTVTFAYDYYTAEELETELAATAVA